MTKPKYGFTSPLITVPRPELGDRYVSLKEPLSYKSRIIGETTVPRGFPTDFASFHVGDFELRGKTDKPAVIHDDEYAKGRFWKIVCDLVFLEACVSEGIGFWRAFFFRFLPVVFSGEASLAWEAHRRGTSNAAKFYKTFKTQPDNHVNLP